jgi:beta-N-acetylhexosaminidase
MTAHVVFSAIDALAPATTSVKMVQEVIRGTIGFDGLLMSDDLSMNALSGTLRERSRATLAAGCDILLHCNGTLVARREVGEVAPPLAGEAKRRADAALAARRPANGFDVTAARGEFAGMMASV